MIDNETVGKFIAAQRKSRGLTQSALAEILNLSNRTISKWETGEGLPEISVLPSLAETLGVSVDELLKGEKKADSSIKIEEVANKRNLKNIFEICFIISVFSCSFGALLGGFNNIYCFAHFSVLFYTHWEIIFDIVSFIAVVFGNLLFYVGAVRLNVIYEKEKIISIAYKKALALFDISCVFIFTFLMRVADRYIGLQYTVSAITALLGVLLIASSIIASKKISKKLSHEKDN